MCLPIITQTLHTHAHFSKVMVGSLNDWQKEHHQFHVLNDKKEERGVKVVRSSIEHVIDIKELLVDDVALLKPGEIVPCDGIFSSGHNIRCDTTGATGESDTIKKVNYDECITLRDQARREGVDDAVRKFLQFPDFNKHHCRHYLRIRRLL